MDGSTINIFSSLFLKTESTIEVKLIRCRFDNLGYSCNLYRQEGSEFFTCIERERERDRRNDNCLGVVAFLQSLLLLLLTHPGTKHALHTRRKKRKRKSVNEKTLIHTHTVLTCADVLIRAQTHVRGQGRKSSSTHKHKVNAFHV